jgi:hypothetical protein
MFFIKENSTDNDFVIVHISDSGKGTLIRLTKAAGETIFFDVRCLSDISDNIKTRRVKKFGKDGIYCRLEENPRKYQKLLKIAKKEMSSLLPGAKEIEAQITDELVTA